MGMYCCRLFGKKIELMEASVEKSIDTISTHSEELYFFIAFLSYFLVVLCILCEVPCKLFACCVRNYCCYRQPEDYSQSV